jgi:ribonuclease BN (tRNA processing enzyme)
MSSRRRFFFTLDVLTDGSEHTGHGTIFLSVRKQPQHIANGNTNKNKNDADADDDRNNPEDTSRWLKENMDVSPPTARYAISGLGDCFARLCADQRMKLSPIRAVFLPNNNQDCTDGLPALLLALHSAGSSSLHVVSPDTENNMEEMMEIILGSRLRSMNVATCQVPAATSSSSSSSSSFEWWKVYEDEFLQVHARRTSSGSGDNDDEDEDEDDDVTFLYTLRNDDNNHVTLALPPPRCSMNILEACQTLSTGDLPLVDDVTRATIDYFIMLNPMGAAMIPYFEKHIKNAKVLMTEPKPTTDPGILIRSQQVARYFNANMPNSFPFGGCDSTENEEISGDSPVRFVQSGTSVILGGNNSYSILDRRIALKERPLQAEDWSTSLDLLRSFAPPPRSNDDENEIDLEDLDEEGNDDENEIDLEDLDEEVDDESAHERTDPTSDPAATGSPQLVVLGTGCASPSAIRGASGYAMIFPRPKENITAADILVIEAGEGVTTMLSRSLLGIFPTWANNIVGIWISHAHLDHYGGLPNLVRSIHDLKEQKTTTDNESKKRKRPISTVPWIVAPPKVLRFLDLTLHCRHGRHCVTGEQLFSPRVHQDPTQPPGPWKHFQSFGVYHGCCPAYGLLLGWQSYTSSETHWFCFSGDTRPCHGLVDSICRHRHNPNEFLLLLHEATFEDGEKEQAIKKKHSTVSEAMQVARDVRAHRVLLTHFSQRYVALNESSSFNESGVSVAFAVDGLWTSLG